MRKYITLSILAGLFLSALPAGAQMRAPEIPEKVSKAVALETNLVDYIYLGTLNVEGQVALGRNISLDVGAKYNPWTYNRSDATKQFQSRQQTYYAGVRWWPWYVYSGWWVEGAAQYQEYNRGGYFNKPETEEGDALGAHIHAGYSLQIRSWFNIDFGIGVWGGMTKYVVYECPNCGRKVEEGSKLFVLPNEAKISAMFIF